MEMNHEYASKGVAGAGLGTGIAGLSLGVLNSMGGLASLGGLFGGNGWNRSTAAQNDVLTALLTADIIRGQSQPCGENTPVSRYELAQAQTIADKDAEIGLLKADKYTDQKLTEVTAYLMGQIKDLSAEVR